MICLEYLKSPWPCHLLELSCPACLPVSLDGAEKPCLSGNESARRLIPLVLMLGNVRLGHCPRFKTCGLHQRCIICMCLSFEEISTSAAHVLCVYSS